MKRTPEVLGKWRVDPLAACAKNTRDWGRAHREAASGLINAGKKRTRVRGVGEAGEGEQRRPQGGAGDAREVPRVFGIGT